MATDKTPRFSVSLPPALRAEVEAYRTRNYIATEAEAVRRLVIGGLVADVAATPAPSPTPVAQGRRGSRV